MSSQFNFIIFRIFIEGSFDIISTHLEKRGQIIEKSHRNKPCDFIAINRIHLCGYVFFQTLLYSDQSIFH